MYSFIENYLTRQANYENVGTKPLYSGHKPDLLFKVSQFLVAIEVKLNPGEALNALSVAYSLVRSPDVNGVILVIPEGKVDEGMKALASQGGIGLATINVESGRWTWILNPNFSIPQFSQHWNYPREVTAGQEFSVTITVNNGGQKTLANVVVSYIEAYPFKMPPGKTNRADTVEIHQGKGAPFTLFVTSQADAQKGLYPLLIKTEMLGAPANYGAMEIRVN